MQGMMHHFLSKICFIFLASVQYIHSILFRLQFSMNELWMTTYIRQLLRGRFYTCQIGAPAAAPCPNFQSIDDLGLNVIDMKFLEVRITYFIDFKVWGIVWYFGVSMSLHTKKFHRRPYLIDTLKQLVNICCLENNLQNKPRPAILSFEFEFEKSARKIFLE